MTWNLTPVQQKSATGTLAAVSITLDSSPVVGNTLLAAFCASNTFQPLNDGWVLHPTNGGQASFVGVYLYYRVVAAGDNLTALRTIAKTLNAAAIWGGLLWEMEGTGPWASATVLDQSISNNPATNNIGTISTGTTATLGQPDGLAVAVFGVARSRSAGTSTFASYSNGFTELAEVPTSGGDAPNLAVAIKDVGNTVAAVETTATMSDLDHQPIGLLFVFKTDPPVTVTGYLSGGAANADRALSIGGTESSVAADDVLPDQSRLLADLGGVYYRLAYLRNEPNLRDLSAGVTVTVDEQPATGLAVAIGVATQAAGVTVPAIVNDTTAPAGVTFGTTADMGTIAPDESRGLWVRLTVTAGATDVIDSPWHLDFDCAPL